MKTILQGLIFIFLFPGFLKAQSDKKWIKQQINHLASSSMQGRGYVGKGMEKSASYIRQQFQSFSLLPLSPDSSYFQHFSLSVNTFPGAAYLKIQHKELKPGADFIVDAAAKGAEIGRVKLKILNLKKIKDSAAWEKTKSLLSKEKAYLVKNLDTPAKYISFPPRRAARELPEGIFILPQKGKLTWTVSQDTLSNTVFYVMDSVLPKHAGKLSVRLAQKYIPAFKAKNVMAFVPGTEKPDSFILFTAHYDHLGKMGPALFPGAQDNASGTALMLSMARYFSRNPQKYSIGFIAFSGEEAGLLGSRYFVDHPTIPLNNIRFVINLDMTGDATNGITVVNALEQKKAFTLLKEINDTGKYLPSVKERDQSANSDHYFFSQKGVPAIFIYTNGTKPFYHDIFDKPQEISLENIDRLQELLQSFAGKL